MLSLPLSCPLLHRRRMLISRRSSRLRTSRRGPSRTRVWKQAPKRCRRQRPGMPRLVAMIDPPAELIIPADRKPLAVAPIYIETLPDLSGLPSSAETQFIAFMLPLILRANLELDHRRKRIDVSFRPGTAKNSGNGHGFRLIRQPQRCRNLCGTETTGAAGTGLDRAGQAAIQSGWGTSRFAIEGMRSMASGHGPGMPVSNHGSPL